MPRAPYVGFPALVLIAVLYAPVPVVLSRAAENLDLPAEPPSRRTIPLEVV